MGAPDREARFELLFTATEMASRPINLFIVLLWNQKLSTVFLWGSRVETDCWLLASTQPGQARSFTVTLLSLVHPRPPVSNLVGKDLFLGPCNLAMGSHDQWQLRAEYTVGSWLPAGGVGQTVGEQKEWKGSHLCPALSKGGRGGGYLGSRYPEADALGLWTARELSHSGEAPAESLLFGCL